MSKKILLAAVVFFLSLGMLFAQAPQQFNYQGVARNTSGQPLANQNIGLQLTIRTGTANGTAQYQETHNVTTNAYGLYNLAVGGGTAVTGTMSAVTWSAGSKFMQVQIDPNGGTSYTNLGSTELLSVPYALYAAGGNQGPAGPQGATGPAGPQGVTGPQGPAGPQGVAGPQGLQGPAGIPGATGPAGSANINGTAGKIIKFTSATTGGNSLINDNDTTVNIGGFFPSNFNSNGLPKLSVKNNSNIGIEIDNNGTSAPGLCVETDNGQNGAIFVRQTGGGKGIYVVNSGGVGLQVHSSITTSSGIYSKHSSSGTAIKGFNHGNYGIAIEGDKNNSKGFAGYFHSNYDAAVLDSGIVRIDYDGSVVNRDHIGLDSRVVPNPAGNYGIGVKGHGGWYGVYGTSSHTGTTGNFGVYGFAKNSGGNSYGVYGISYNNTGSSTGNKYGVYGRASGGTNNYAGYFASGSVQVSNMLSKGGGTFKIDHPLDPENKYLYHSFVESPDMMNIYNGNITTDAQGYATVTMPDYFNALNVDFRYQLTVMGTFAQAIVKEKINGNSFVLQTNLPNVEVSWQVTGVRNDKFAQANRVQVEVEKPEDEKGLYLHSEAWGQSKDKDMNYIIHQKPSEDKENETQTK